MKISTIKDFVLPQLSCPISLAELFWQVFGWEGWMDDPCPENKIIFKMIINCSFKKISNWKPPILP